MISAAKKIQSVINKLERKLSLERDSLSYLTGSSERDVTEKEIKDLQEMIASLKDAIRVIGY